MTTTAPGRCDGCALWERLDYPAPALRPGGAASGDDPTTWGQCGRQNLPDPPIWSQDASDYSSWIGTRASFGCVEWRPKP